MLVSHKTKDITALPELYEHRDFKKNTPAYDNYY